ncbi:MAG: carotenoid oxygenase family protein, partial [Hormoscilla sp. SP12CHS1]|nr:carotenoid oxygenase family protein [Hormoscilla sp. SP12CHS1]
PKLLAYETSQAFTGYSLYLNESHDLGENRYPTEPIYVPDARNTKQGWVLTVIYDGGVDRSEVWVYDSERMDDEPVCKL